MRSVYVRGQRRDAVGEGRERSTDFRGLHTKLVEARRVEATGGPRPTNLALPPRSESFALAMPTVMGAIAMITATVTQKRVCFVEEPDFEVHAHHGGEEGAWEQDHRRECEDGHDPVRFVASAGDQHVEGADDRLARVAGLLKVASKRMNSDWNRSPEVVVAERLQLWMCQRDKGGAVGRERAPELADLRGASRSASRCPRRLPRRASPGRRTPPAAVRSARTPRCKSRTPIPVAPPGIQGRRATRCPPSRRPARRTPRERGSAGRAQ